MPMDSSRGKLVIVSAPSGAGKTTLVHHLLNSGLGLEFSVSATSRPRRDHEEDGHDYYFMSTSEFQQRVANDEFLEWEEVYEGIFYGTLRAEVETRISEGRHMIFDIDVMGGINIKKQFDHDALSIFVMPPSLDELEHRLRNRSSDDDASIRKRLDKAAFEMGFANQFDRIVINDDLNHAREEITNLVQGFLSHKQQ